MEKSRFPYAQFSRRITEAKIIDGYHFKYSAYTFRIFLHQYTDADKASKSPAVFWQASRQKPRTEREIWLPTNIYREEFQKPVLFHETLEAHLYSKFSRDERVLAPMQLAHRIAEEYDRKYAEEHLEEKVYQEYLGLRHRLIVLQL